MAQLDGMLSAARISLILSGESCTPQEIEATLGYTATRLVHKGDLVSKIPALKAAESEWRHAVPLTKPLGRDDDL